MSSYHSRTWPVRAALHGRSAARALLAALIVAAALAAPVAVGAAAAEASLSGVVNVNTATPEQLEMLPGIGESKARAILEARDERGRFESVEELLEVTGIGERALARIRPFVALTGRTTLEQQ
jgi:competence protein ComEA